MDAARLLEGFGDKTNWKEVFQQRDNDKVLQLFRFSRDSIAFQAMVKQVLTENQELRALIMTIKNEIVKILLEQGQLDMFLIILEGLELKADDLNELVNALQDNINVGEMEDDSDSQPCSPAKPGSKRQDYTSLLNFLTQSQWDELLEDVGLLGAGPPDEVCEGDDGVEAHLGLTV